MTTKTPATAPLPDWLADEASLADEAVLFGLSEARPDERLAQIRLAFLERTVLVEKQIEQAQEHVSDLNAVIDAAQTDLNALQTLQLTGQKRLFSLAGQRLLIRFGLSLVGCAAVIFSTNQLLPTPFASVLLGGLVGLGGIGAALIRYAADGRARLNQQQADRLIQEQRLAKTESKLVDYQQTKQQLIADLYQYEAIRDAQHAHRDRLIRLFESEFDLARSLRYSLNPNDYRYSEGI
ncbi:hypothetical protein [Fibrella aquatilis]|uniref:Uncharacterized protein n=1 Tax=Fibrella aquatilis TaxID=2817059 RepID=A0A939GB68_9BACT|nr:hypothetical protein [Fibrella aquatilis]MBO0933168.1 hypothetical protein [Fibrella aquatilis]